MATNQEKFRRELLITLEYLVLFTDEKHPAMASKICEYAYKQYGIKYHQKPQPGDEIRRDRVQACLVYLYNESINGNKALNIIIEKTDKGKFYVESKYFNDEQIVQIGRAIKNDKYTADDKYLVESLLDLTTNIYNREKIFNEISSFSIRSNKYKEEKILKTLKQISKDKKIVEVIIEEIFINKKGNKQCRKVAEKCLIYCFKEWNNVLFVIMVPLAKSGLIVLPVDKVKISSYYDDFDEKRDVDALFKQNSNANTTRYNSIDEYLHSCVGVKDGGFITNVAFWYLSSDKRKIESSFLRYFDKNIDSIECKSFSINRKESKIMPIDKTKGGTCVVNVLANPISISNWIKSSEEVSKAIHVVGPDIINVDLAYYFYHRAKKYKDFIPDIEVEFIEKDPFKYPE
ncbi:MAG: hypothetical protein MJ227_00880 [Bacilli bacterium]|nr:hypothetical protein [Bacilli bacterium]